MPILSEYIKLRTEQNRELSWGELDDNFLYVANPWVSYRHYKEGSIVYYDAGITGSTGLSWWRATTDNGPSVSFNIGEWESIGAANAGSGSIVVQNGLSTNTVSVLDFASSDFNISVVGSTATISLDGSAIKYWLESGDPSIGTGQNAAAVIHTGNVVIGAGSFGSYKLAVNGNTNITGDLTVGGTVNTVDVLQLATDYAAHTHTILPTSFTNYSILFPNASGQLADTDIDTGTLANGQVLSWNNSTQKWINSSPATASLQTLSDVTFAYSLANNQIIQYNSTSGKWTNRSLNLSSDTGFTTPGMAHNHDTRYYTKSQLGSSSGSYVNWFNLSSIPTDFSDYVVGSSHMGPIGAPNARVIQSSDSSINIDISTPNIIDLTVASAIGLEIQQDSSVISTSSTALDFVTNIYGGFTITDITGGLSQIELNAPKISVSTDGTPGLILTDQLYLGDPDGTGSNIADANVYFSSSSNPAPGQYNIYGVSKQWVGQQDILGATILNPLHTKLVFVDNADVTWHLSEDTGNDYHLIEANIVALPNLETQDNSISIVSNTSVINYKDSATIHWAIANPSGGDIDVQADLHATLDEVCLNGATTQENVSVGILNAVGYPGGSYIEVSENADTSTGVGGIILWSPNGTRFLITVDDYGNLITTPV